MGAFWIGGLPGSGKSLVLALLKSRGFSAIDVDAANLCHWRNKATSETVNPVPRGARTVEWQSRHERFLNLVSVQHLVEETHDEPLFIGGSAPNEAEAWPLFDGLLFLTVDEATLRRRLTTRTNNDFGKGPGELKAIMGWIPTTTAAYRKAGATLIDGAQPPPLVLKAVLEAALG